MEFTAVTENMKGENLKLDKSVKTTTRKLKVEVNNSQWINGNVNINVKVKERDKKDRQMRPQEKWKLEAPKEVYPQTKNTEKYLPLV